MARTKKNEYNLRSIVKKRNNQIFEEIYSKNISSRYPFGVFLLEITEHVQMKNIFSKNVFKKQFGIHIYSNYSSKDYRVSVMFRLRITRIFPRYSSAILLLECSRSAGRHRATDPTKPGIANRKFLLLLFHRLVFQRVYKSETRIFGYFRVIGLSSIVPFVAKTKFPTRSSIQRSLNLNHYLTLQSFFLFIRESKLS